MREREKPVFGLVHGSWHGAWCWSLLENELDALGFQHVAPDLPVEDPEATFDDYAAVVEESLADHQNIVLVGHSRAGNVIPRSADRLSARKIIFLCSSFEPSTIGRPLEDEENNMPTKNTQLFKEGVIKLENDMTLFDKEIAKKVFYNDCTPEIQGWAASKLRMQRRSPEEPALQEWPDNIQQEYVVCTNDRVLNPEWEQYVARQWLGIEPVEFPAGHSPFLSKPRQLAELLVKLAGQNNN